MNRNQFQCSPRITLILILLAISTIFNACTKSKIEQENDYQKSYDAFLNFKQVSNNSYQYTVLRYGWPDHRSETTITVTNGKVTQRYYKNISLQGLENIPPDALEWTEHENELDSHQSTYAAQVKTLDQIYELAKTHWLLKREGSTPTFETSHNGLISTCGFSASNCMDDCFDGITIKSIAAL